MTEQPSTTQSPDFAQKFFSDEYTQAQYVDTRSHRAYQKRYWAQLSCSRLIESGLPGADPWALT